MFASPARAIILNGAVGRNSSAPTDPALLRLWNLEGTVGPVIGTPIGPRDFITAHHALNNTLPFTLTLDGVTYATSGSAGAGGDLRVWHLASSAPSFTTWAPIWNPAVDGSEVGRPMVVFGRGADRGSPLFVAANSPNQAGWNWGTLGSSEPRSWGLDTVASIIPLSTSDPTQLLTFDFKSTGTNEATMSGNDSGGGLFVQNTAGQWKLAGINYAVDVYWASSTINNGNYLQAAITDARGLWTLDDNNQPLYVDPATHPDPVVGVSYTSRVAYSYAAVRAYAPIDGDATIDGSVNFNDLLALAANYGTAGSAVWASGDFNFDGNVNFSDLLILAANYGASASGGIDGEGNSNVANASMALVPEPACALGMLVAFGFLSRPRRLRRFS
ncbi:MAG: hypothetical protein QM770_21295 [Tepidisphaeraceae bacterium]